MTVTPVRLLTAVLVLVASLGGARLYRAAVLSAPINEGISSEIRLANALELTRRVAARFEYIAEHGPIGRAAPWPLRTEADHLLTGGDCGHAATALGAVFVARHRPFRVLQANIGLDGAGHIMFETPDDAGRWILLDPIRGRGFQRPGDDRLLAIDEIRALPPGDREWLEEEYRTGGASLFTPYRRTNWSRLGVLTSAVRVVGGETWMQGTSLRATVLQSDRLVTEGALIGILLITVVDLRTRLRSAPRPT